MSQTSMTVVEVVCPGQQCCSLLLRAQVHRDPLLMYITLPVGLEEAFSTSSTLFFRYTRITTPYTMVQSALEPTYITPARRL